MLVSGAEGNRTPDLLHAMQALSQLSYGPGFGEARSLTRLQRPGEEHFGGLVRRPADLSCLTRRVRAAAAASASRADRRSVPASERR